MHTLNRQNNSRQLHRVDLTLVVVVACSALALANSAQAYPTASIDFYSTANKLNDFAKSTSTAPMDEVSSSGGAAAAAAAAASGDSAPSAAPLAGSDVNFHQFINSKSTPESTIIGELKPNSSAWELMLLRSKIAETILKMQEADHKQQQLQNIQPPSHLDGAECFIEVTRVSLISFK